jgi:hypothetical protein
MGFLEIRSAEGFSGIRKALQFFSRFREALFEFIGQLRIDELVLGPLKVNDPLISPSLVRRKCSDERNN